MFSFIKKVKNRIKLRQKIKTWRNIYLDRFVFIHINRTGGSSIGKALLLPFEHKTALEKINELGRRRWENKYTFTVIRNPWDRVVSHYHYRVQTNQTELGTNTLDFREWVQLTYGSKDSFYYDNPKMFMPQLEWISDHQGNILVDHICRFERLNDDFSSVCAKLRKSVTLPHVKASKRGNYRDYYDDDTFDIVAKWFRKDIENFGYQF